MVVDVTNGIDSWSRPYQEEATSHQLPVLGFSPDDTYTVTVTVTDADSVELVSAPLSITTAALPVEFPVIEVATSMPARMEPGLIMFDATSTGGYVIVIEPSGRVVWFLSQTQSFSDVRKLDNGNLRYILGGDIFEIDMLGNQVQHFENVVAGGQVAPGATAVVVRVTGAKTSEGSSRSFEAWANAWAAATAARACSSSIRAVVTRRAASASECMEERRRELFWGVDPPRNAARAYSTRAPK